MTPPLLHCDRIVVRFGAVVAVDAVSFGLNAGEVVGLVGDNGAGKSTLAAVLSGAQRPERGRILWDGAEVRFHSVHAAQAAGIDMVYQDLGLVGSLSVADNVFLGRERVRRRLGFWPHLDRRRMRREAAGQLESLGIELNSVDRRVETLSMGQRQAVAVARAMVNCPRLLILDEPTAALSVKEVERVLDLVRRLKQRSVAVILISHRLEDIYEVCDRAIVLYRGRKVADAKLPRTRREDVVACMMGAKTLLREEEPVGASGG